MMLQLLEQEGGTAQVKTGGEKGLCVLDKLVLPIGASYAAVQKGSKGSHGMSMVNTPQRALIEGLLYVRHGSRLTTVNKMGKNILEWEP